MLPRREFGALQSKTLPIQFATQALTPLIIGLTAPYAIPTYGLALLGLSSLGGLANALYLTPKCAKIKETRWNLIDTQFGGDEQKAKDSGSLVQLDKQFGQYHVVSLIANLLSILTIGAYGGAVLGTRLGPI